jgi:PIN domain nuclease of toxin-antitoxin system
MPYLVDTVVFLWGLGEVHRLSDRARQILSDESEEIYLSAASSWEIAIKVQKKRLSLPGAPKDFLNQVMQRWELLPLAITHMHAMEAAELPMHHSDPFDRMLIAQARSEGLVLLTADRMFANYDVETLWSGRG